MESGFQVRLPTGITWGTFTKHGCQDLPQWIQLFWMSGCVRKIKVIEQDRADRPLTLLLSCLDTALTVSDCLLWAQNLQHYRWDGGEILWLLSPWRGPGQPSPRLTTFQVLQDKTNSINMKPGLQFGHRLMRLSVCIHSGIINRNLELQSLKSHPQSTLTSWDPFPNWDSRYAVPQDFPALFKSGCWSKPNLVMYSLLYFSFLLMLVCWK